MDNSLRMPAERLFENELKLLAQTDSGKKPEGWKLSPQAVYTYIVGGNVEGTEITPKFIGHRQLVEIAIATLMTDKGLLLSGDPGTAKTWLSEHLAAAVCGDSTLVLQGTLGVTEDQIKYGWNYALLLTEGPGTKSIVKTPLYRAMEQGSIVRIEELSRCSSETADALISVLSEKSIAIPELNEHLWARRGFGLIATANTRDKGVNELSAALKRRFNVVVLPSPATLEAEVEIVRLRVEQISKQLELDVPQPDAERVTQAVTVFRELRQGRTLDGRQSFKPAGGAMSAAQAISLLTSSMSLAAAFGDGIIRERQLAGALSVSMAEDLDAWREYCETVLKRRDPLLFESCADWLP